MNQQASAKFIKTAILPKDYPLIRNLSGELLPEVAVVGRSNVGKSSLLNTLFATKNLVKTSSTPGKTQALNFFSFNNEIAFADLPGYGFAKVPLSVKKEWGPMVQAYLEERRTLKLILLLMDIRRTPNEEDLQFLEWAIHTNRAIILVLTKCDKVTQSQQHELSKGILDAMHVENLHHVCFSAVKHRGRKELLRLIGEAIADESSDE